MSITSNVYVVGAICGNWWWESGIDPGIYESLKVVPLTDNNIYGGYGLGQWTNAPARNVFRRTALVTWLRANNYSDDSGNGQLDYFVTENTWYRNGYGANFQNLQDFLSSTSNDIQMLTYAFMQGWEGIWNGTQNQRVQYALQVVNYIQEHYQDDPGNWITGNRYLSEAERYHNALLVYNWLVGNDVPPDPDPPQPPEPEPKGKKKMPLWMKIRYHY